MHKLKAQGKEIKILEKEPEINFIEEKAITASRICGDVLNISEYAKITGILDLESFFELVLYAKGIAQELKKDK